MFSPMSPSDFVVAEQFRWRGVVYKKGSGLPPGIPQGAITQFMHRDPPLIKLRAKAKRNGSNGAARVTKKKTAKKKTSKRG